MNVWSSCVWLICPVLLRSQYFLEYLVNSDNSSNRISVLPLRARFLNARTKLPLLPKRLRPCNIEPMEDKDHKKIGKELDLFTFSDLIGPGLPLWTPKGTMVRHLLDDFVWELRKKYGYQKVEIPHITKKDLYETSGHWDKFEDDLFRISTREGYEFALKDAHVFCRIEQAKDEIQKIWEIVHFLYQSFGLNLELRLSLRDPSTPEKYLGNQELWDKAEKILRGIAGENKTKYVEAPGEAAFYAPKLDFMTKDSLGREWQVATIQLDVNMPERFDLTCVNERGGKERNVMIHAAIMGSLERFMSILLEHTQGTFPLWLSPIQVKILPIGEAHFEYAKKK